MNRVVQLKITSYRGISLGATHFYGRLSYYTPKNEFMWDEVTHKLTVKEAKYLNGTDGLERSVVKFRAGQESGRFETKEQLIETAIEKFRKSFVPHGYKLLLGNDHADPCEILWCEDKDLQFQLEELNEQAKANNRWQGNQKTMARICKQWDELIKQLQ